MIAISNLNTYNFLFIMLGLLLHWRPKRFLAAVVKSVPATSGVLIQFPFYGAIAAILTSGEKWRGSDRIGPDQPCLREHVHPASLPAGDRNLLGDTWIFRSFGRRQMAARGALVMQAANDLKVHLGWAVQVYNAAEALPNLINPFWMLPLLGVLGLRARTLWALHSCSCLLHLPVVLFLLWALAYTLEYHPPVIP